MRRSPPNVVCSCPSGDERKEQKQAVEAIERFGGEVFYDYQLSESKSKPKMIAFDPKAKPKDPNAFHRVIYVGLREAKVGDDDIKILNLLPYLMSVDLTGTKVTDAGLAHLKGLKHLQSLMLTGTRINGTGFMHLKESQGVGACPRPLEYSSQR